MGLSQDSPPPHSPSSAVVPLCSAWLIVSNAYLLSFSFAENYYQMEEISYLMLIST